MTETLPTTNSVEPAALSQWQRVAYIFTAPSKTFDAEAGGCRW